MAEWSKSESPGNLVDEVRRKDGDRDWPRGVLGSWLIRAYVLFRSRSPPLDGGPNGSRVENGDRGKVPKSALGTACKICVVFLRVMIFPSHQGVNLRGREGVCVFFLPGLDVVVTRWWWWWWVYAGSPRLTMQSERKTVAGQNSLGDDRGRLDNGSNGLGNHMGAPGESRSRDDRRSSDDRAVTDADGNAGETTGSGEGDSQDGSEDSLWRRL